jgi:hypothetical protein
LRFLALDHGLSVLIQLIDIDGGRVKSFRCTWVLLLSLVMTACGGSGSASKTQNPVVSSSSLISSSQISSSSSSDVSSQSSQPSSQAVQLFEVSVAEAEGGALTPAGAKVAAGESLSLEVVVDEHFVLADIAGCGGILNGTQFVISSVESDCLVQPLFEKKIYQVEVVAGEGGSVTPTTASVPAGESVSFQLSANNTYELGEIEGCSGSLKGQSYVIDALWGDCVLQVNFAPVMNRPSLSMTLTAQKKFVFSWTAVAHAQEYRLLENPDGKSGYSLVQTLKANQRRLELDVGLHQKFKASYLLEACDKAGRCRSSNAVSVPDDISAAVGLIKNSEMLTASAVSRDGRYLALGFEFDDSGAVGVNGDRDVPDVDRAGSVHLYQKNNGTWSRVAILNHEAPRPGIKFGRSLAFNGDGTLLVVGTEERDGDHPSTGAAYVFTRAGSFWQQTATIFPEYLEDWLQFASEVALSDDGKTLIIGAVYDSGTADNPASKTVNSSGAAHVYKKNGTFWDKVAYLKASNPAVSEAMGASLSLSADGKVLAMVNSPYPGTGVGLRAVIFVEKGGVWSEEASIPLVPSGEEGLSGHRSGLVLSQDGSRFAVSSVYDGNDPDALTSGAILVFKRGLSGWQQEAKMKTPKSDCGWGGRMGDSIAMGGTGDTIVATSSCPNHGPTVFTRTGEQWQQYGYLPRVWAYDGLMMDGAGTQLFIIDASSNLWFY